MRAGTSVPLDYRSACVEHPEGTHGDRATSPCVGGELRTQTGAQACAVAAADNLRLGAAEKHLPRAGASNLYTRGSSVIALVVPSMVTDVGFPEPRAGKAGMTCSGV